MKGNEGIQSIKREPKVNVLSSDNETVSPSLSLSPLFLTPLTLSHTHRHKLSLSLSLSLIFIHAFSELISEENKAKTLLSDRLK